MKNKVLTAIFVAAFSSGFHAQQAFSIDEALQYAMTNNVNVQKAKIDQTIAAQKVKETTGIGLPQISGQGTYNYFLNIPVQLLPAELAGGAPGEYIPVKFGQKQNMSGGLTLTQLLFNGSYLVGLQSAKAYRQTADLAEEKTEISVKDGISMSYAAVLVTDENVATLERNRVVAEKALNEVREVYRVGLTELQSVEQLEYNYKSLLANQQNLARTREKLAMTLKYLMNYPLDQPITLTTSLDELVRRNEGLVGLDNNYDISGHIDYRLKQNALTLSELQLKLQRSKSLPTLAAALSSTYNGYADKFTFFNNNQQWFNTSVFALQLDIPIFSGLQRHWQTQQAKLNVEKAKLDLSDTEKNLKNSAYSSAIDYDNAYNLYKNAQELIALSESIYRKMQIKFKEGMATSTELQTVEAQLYEAQAKYYEAAIGLVRARTAYDTALGNIGNVNTSATGINQNIQNNVETNTNNTEQNLQNRTEVKTEVQPLQQTQTQQSNQTPPPTQK